jgi:hypothetical protein
MCSDQAGHLVLGQPDLVAAELRQRQVGHLEVDAVTYVSGQPDGVYVRVCRRHLRSFVCARELLSLFIY